MTRASSVPQSKANDVRPAVTICIVNWNYARFLGSAIRSVKAQTYKNLHCLVIDNGSTDGSQEVLTSEIAGDSRFEAVFMTENLGHLGAIIANFSRIKGHFVVFLDADDMLLSHFVERHLEIHLTTEVGITSNSVVEIDTVGKILSGGVYIRGDLAKDHNAIENIKYAWHVPRTRSGWHWSPAGSANMYRMDSLQLALALAPNDIPRDYFGDTLFNATAHASAGTVIIHDPLSTYRIHGGNDGSMNVGLTQFRRLKSSSYERSIRQRTDMGLRLIQRWPEIQPALPHLSFWDTLDIILRERQPFFRDPRFIAELRSRIPALVKSEGLVNTISQMIQRNIFIISPLKSRAGTP